MIKVFQAHLRPVKIKVKNNASIVSRPSSVNSKTDVNGCFKSEIKSCSCKKYFADLYKGAAA
jgi:hypothetical protein